VVVLVPGINLMGIMLTAQFINGILLPVLLVFLMIIINNRRIMGAFKNGKLANTLSVLTISVVIVLSGILLVMQILGVA
jgi:Mn2+/Fe2+ NRAMP family transporter